MPVREFTDERGRRWRAWDIRPESIHPVTKSEDYHPDCFVTGWIVFETVEADEKRRLCPWPMHWMLATDERLRELLSMAEVVQQRPESQRDSGAQPAVTYESVPDKKAAAPPDVSDLLVVRTFRYPGGRFWSVCVVSYPEDGGAPVLRFQSGMRIIDLRAWPKDWADKPDDALVAMLREGAPRRPSTVPPSGSPNRRWNDPPQPRA
jgi:hypothetical protein